MYKKSIHTQPEERIVLLVYFYYLLRMILIIIISISIICYLIENDSQFQLGFNIGIIT